jgi:hypothetical protein
LHQDSVIQNCFCVRIHCCCTIKFGFNLGGCIHVGVQCWRTFYVSGLSIATLQLFQDSLLQDGFCIGIHCFSSVCDGFLSRNSACGKGLM